MATTKSSAIIAIKKKSGYYEAKQGIHFVVTWVASSSGRISVKFHSVVFKMHNLRGHAVLDKYIWNWQDGYCW